MDYLKRHDFKVISEALVFFLFFGCLVPFELEQKMFQSGNLTLTKLDILLVFEIVSSRLPFFLKLIDRTILCLVLNTKLVKLIMKICRAC